MYVGNMRSDFDTDKDSDSEYFQAVAPYVYQTVSAFSMLRDYVASLVDPHIASNEYVRGVSPLIHYLGERCQAFAMLMQYGYLWDADIVMRCIMEASIRIGYLSFASQAERKIRAKEYWEDLSEINRLKQSDRAKLAVQTSGAESLRRGLEPLILSTIEEASLREKWSSKKRSDIEQKWSFTRIINAIEKHMIETTGTSAMKSILWNYGLSSHLIHADETAMMITADRLDRPEPEQKKQILAHAARLFRDELASMVFVAFALTYVLEEPQAELNTLVEKIEPLYKKLNELNQAFYDYLDQGAFSEARIS